MENSDCIENMNHFIEDGEFEQIFYQKDNKFEKYKSDPQFWFKLGDKQVELGNNINARKCFNKVLEIDPENISAWEALGHQHYILNVFKPAQEAYNRALEICDLNMRMNIDDASLLTQRESLVSNIEKCGAAIHKEEKLRKNDENRVKHYYGKKKHPWSGKW